MNKRYERGCALFDSKRYDMAEREFRAALAEEPESPVIHRMLALSLMNLKQLEPALVEAQEAVRFAPKVAHSHYIVSLVLVKLNRYRDSERALDEAKKLSPMVAQYHVQDAALALDQGFVPEATQKIKHALSLDPNDERAMRILALATERSGDIKAATELAEQTLKLAPENAYSQELMGNILMKKKNVGQAILHYREALRINPSMESARKNYMHALNSRNPLYGFILGICWYADKPPRLFIGHPYAILAGLALYIIMLIVGTIMSQVSKHLLTMFMRFDPVAIEALDPAEIQQANLLAGWIACSMVVSTILLCLFPLHTFFLPSVVFLYGAPLIFTRLFELRNDPLDMEKYKKYCIGAAVVGVLAIVCSFGPDTFRIHNLPPNFQDVSGALVIVFMFMCLFARRFPQSRSALPAATQR